MTRNLVAGAALAATLLLLAACTPDGSPASIDPPDPVPVASHRADGTCDNGFDDGRVGGPQRVEVRLTGCVPVSAPHRRARRATPQLILDLARVAPPSWRTRLQARVS